MKGFISDTYIFFRKTNLFIQNSSFKHTANLHCKLIFQHREEEREERKKPTDPWFMIYLLYNKKSYCQTSITPGISG